MSISKILREIIGDDCDTEIEIFRSEKIDVDAFWSLDRETLAEIGKVISVIFLLFIFWNVENSR